MDFEHHHQESNKIICIKWSKFSQTYMSICEVHDIRKTTPFSMSQTNTVLQDDEVCPVLDKKIINLTRTCLGVHLVQLLSSHPKIKILKVWMIGHGSVRAQLDPGHELHAAADDGVLVRVLLQPDNVF